MIKLSDLVSKKTNSRNHQISLDIKKNKLKELDIDISQILNMRVKK